MVPGISDKRHAPRFQVAVPIKNIISQSVLQVNAYTTDISSSGIGVMLDKQIALNEELEICLKMADNGEEIVVRGRTQWLQVVGQNKFRAGIVLVNSSLKPIPLVLRSIRSHFRYSVSERTALS